MYLSVVIRQAAATSNLQQWIQTRRASSTRIQRLDLLLSARLCTTLSEGSDAEYIELHNIKNYSVPLRVYDPCVSGYASWKFTQGPNFDFNSLALPNDINIPANGYLIVARNKTMFTSTYGAMPAGVQVLGPFANSTKLSNDGENVETFNAGRCGHR